MGILGWIIFGLIVGLIAKAIRPGKAPGGWIMTIVIGIVGAMIGGWIGKLIGWGGVDGFDLKSMLIAILGSILLLYIIGKLRKK